MQVLADRSLFTMFSAINWWTTWASLAAVPAHGGVVVFILAPVTKEYPAGYKQRPPDAILKICLGQPHFPSECFRERLRGNILYNNQNTARRHSPVFVVGCHRSGTNLLYDTLLSAGGFAVYRGYLPVYKMLIPRFGSLNSLANRNRLMKTWLRSKGFRRSGLDPQLLTEAVLRECRSGGDFICITMDQVACNQNVERWALYDPDNVLFIPQIKAEIPSALFVHIIRDGRDIALSLKAMGGFQPLPWDRGPRSLQATALYWEWMVRKGRQHGRSVPSDYLEIHYEDLVLNPQRALTALSEFLDQELDYDRIQATSLGRIRKSNSSFLAERDPKPRSPVNRWKARLTHQEIAALETVIGECLEEHGYSLTTGPEERTATGREKRMQYLYARFLDTKLWLKTRTPLGRLANLSTLELADPEEFDPPDPSESNSEDTLHTEDQTVRSTVRD